MLLLVGIKQERFFSHLTQACTVLLKYEKQFPEEQGGLLAEVSEAEKLKSLAAVRSDSMEQYCNQLVYLPRVLQ